MSRRNLLAAPATRPTGSFRRLTAALLLFNLAACTHLAPVDLPREEALPAADSPLWQRVAAERDGDWFYLLNTGEEALERRLAAIDSASRSIDMETFLWKPDRTGLRVLRHLVAAADRGVRVRVLLDDAFTAHEDLMLHAVNAHPNIEYRIYNPYTYRPESMVLRQLFALGEFARTDHRMHNKALVVDGRAAIVGGRNLADEYFGHHDSFNFRDLEVLAFGPAVSGISSHFDGYWNSPWSLPVDTLVDGGEDGELEILRARIGPGETAAPSREELLEQWLSAARLATPGRARFHADRPAEVDPGAPGEAPNQLARRVLEAIDAARREVTLVSAYLIPTPELEGAVERAEARGVEVRVLTNSLRSNNHLAAHSAYQRHMARLLTHGADLHEVRAEARDRHLYMRRPIDEKRLGLHAKLLLVDDDRLFIGSCNLDPRSFNLNNEVGLFIESRELNGQVREMLALDFHPRNAWAVRHTPEGRLVWVGDDQVHHAVPADSPVQRMEDWFLGLLPIDSEL